MNKNKKRFETHSKDYKNITEYKVKEETTLLEFLLTHVKGQSRNSIKGLLTHSLVSVDGAPIKQFDFHLCVDDVVIISKTPIKKRREFQVKPPIIYEDEDIIAINKPSGLLSIASDKEKGKTAYRMLTEYVQRSDRKNRIYVVHRLDEDTSGVLIVSKKQDIKEAFQKDWNNLVSDRGYIAIVEGHLDEKEGTIKSYLKTNALQLMYSSNDKKHGKLAITHYKVLQENENYSLVEVHIDSGRKNQIRVHMGDLGHFIIGDDKYGEPSNPIGRLGLHANSLIVKHPFKDKTYKLTSPIPQCFEELMAGTYVPKKKKVDDDRKTKKINKKSSTKKTNKKKINSKKKRRY